MTLTVKMLHIKYVVFFFKQKTAYEMRISDWSSDVCSSDLMRVIDSHILLPNMQRAGRSATEQQTRASSPSEKSVSPFSRSIEANGAGGQGVWTPRATQQAAPLRPLKAFIIGLLINLGYTRTRTRNEAVQAGHNRGRAEECR